MNILLINPFDPEVYGRMESPDHPHMGLAYLAAAIENAGHRVTMLDMHADNISAADLKELVLDLRPDVAGLTATTPLIEFAFELADLLKSSTGCTIVLGGIHPTLMHHECIANPSVDYVVKGEGEYTIVELLDCIEKENSPEGIDGLLYKNAEGAAVETPDRCAIGDLDDIPFPARHLIKNHKYSYPDALFTPAYPMITSRGCPGKCTFCSAAFLHGRKFRFRSAGNVVDEIELLIEKYRAKEIHIWDDNFVTNKKRVFEIRDEMLRRKLKIFLSFPNGVRIDSVNSELLSALKEMGTYSLAFGVESGSQEILDRARKNITLDKIEKTFELAKRMKFEIWAFSLLGLPCETEETIRRTMDFAIKLDPDVAKFHILKPYPRTAVYEELAARSLILDSDYRRYGIHTPPVHRLPDISADDLLRWQQKAYRKFYLRPSKILKHALRMKTINRLRLNTSAAFSILKQIFQKG